MGPTNGDTSILDAMRAWLARGNLLFQKDDETWLYISPTNDPPPDGAWRMSDEWVAGDPHNTKLVERLLTSRTLERVR